MMEKWFRVPLTAASVPPYTCARLWPFWITTQFDFSHEIGVKKLQAGPILQDHS